MSRPANEDEESEAPTEAPGAALEPAQAQPPSTDELAAALDVMRRQLASRPAGEAEGASTEILAIAEQVTVGPIPSSREMDGYQRVDPALPARIMDGADSERGHRHRVEERQSKTASFVSVVSVVGSVLFILFMAGLAAYAISQGSDLPALAAIISALAPIAITLIERALRSN